MNHILDYKGYKLFQSSYDISGEKEETHLSVNHDYWGTLITYIGYFLLYFGLICILFVKGTRFDSLKQTLKKIRYFEKNPPKINRFFGDKTIYSDPESDNNSNKMLTHINKVNHAIR